MLNFSKKERSLGVAKGKRKYDLPLNKGNGGRFLKILVTLMTILAVFALSASFALSEMTNRWSSGLENKATIEIPAEDNFGNLLDKENIDKSLKNVLDVLLNNSKVETAEIMSEAEITKLVAPWLGDDVAFDNVPLPGIITVSFKKDSDVNYQILESRLKNYGEHIRLDTHSSWLADLLKFTGALNFASILISALIGITTIVAVAGAIQSRMAVYHDELELLHLMGAGDSYISKQLQRYSFITCLQGSAIGAFIGMTLIFITAWLLKQKDISLVPDFSMSIPQIVTLVILPFFIAFLGMLTAKHTVLRELAKMP